MAELNKTTGNITAFCVHCGGARTGFEWHRSDKSPYGEVGQLAGPLTSQSHWVNRLYKCAVCGHGAVGVVVQTSQTFPAPSDVLMQFWPEAQEPLSLPKEVPEGIQSEFREAEKCLANECNRAAAGLFRSVLEKTLRANKYPRLPEERVSLAKRIEEAAKDGVITQARKKRAHDEVRVLGNDVLHDEWKPIPKEDVEASRFYCQRILEDFYDDRPSVVALLTEAKRLEAATGEPPANGSACPSAPSQTR